MKYCPGCAHPLAWHDPEEDDMCAKTDCFCQGGKASSDDPLSWWDATRFVWHFRWHPDHAETVWHDYRAGVTRCACGKTWGAR